MRGRVVLYLELHGYSNEGRQTDRPSHEYEMFITQNKKEGGLGETNVHLIICSYGSTNTVTNGTPN
jgi:hypothetical protein